MLRSYTISRNLTRVGFILYGMNAEIPVFLKDTIDSTSAKAALNNIDYPGDGSNIDAALKFAAQNFFTLENGARIGVPKILVVFTDALSDNDPSETAKQVIEDGFKLVVIGIGKEINDEYLEKIVADPLILPDHSIESIKDTAIKAVDKTYPGTINYYEISLVDNVALSIFQFNFVFLGHC